jgi:hypothetical protein
MLLSLRPWLPLAACLLALSTAVMDFPSTGVDPFTLGDALLVAALMASVMNVDVRTTLAALARCPLVALPFVVFLLATLLGALTAITADVDAGRVIGDARVVLYLLSALLVGHAFLAGPTPAPLVAAAVGAVAISAGLALAQLFVGPDSVLYLANDPHNEVITCPLGPCATTELSQSFMRIRGPGLLLSFVAGIFAACYLLWGARTRRLAASFVLVAALVLIALSFNRNMVLSFLGAIAVVWCIAAPNGRLRAALALTALAFLFPLALGVGADSELSHRFVSVGDLASLRSDQSLESRDAETVAAISTIRSHPVVGVGWGSPYSREVSNANPKEPKLWIHNQYLGLWLKTGLVGLIAWLTLVLGGIVTGIRVFRHGRPSQTWLGAGVATSLVALSLSSLVAIYVLDVRGMFVFGGLFGLALALAHREGRNE